MSWPMRCSRRRRLASTRTSPRLARRGAGDQKLVAGGRRHRRSQRSAAERVLPEPCEGSVLRLAEGPVLVFDELDYKREPVALRAVVLPDGETLEFEHRRFDRAA